MTLSKSSSSDPEALGSLRIQNTVNNPNTDELVDLFFSMEQQQLDLEETADWKKDNMEYDLRSTEWIVEKVKADNVYAQNLYASMCNRDFVKNDVWPILTDKRWGCSWRHAGGIIADMQEIGDYINWYCSGIIDLHEIDEKLDNLGNPLNEDEKKKMLELKAHVPEGVVTDEIRKDLLQLGWIVLNDIENE